MNRTTAEAAGTISAEAQLLALCARNRLDAAAAAQVCSLAGSGLDWDLVVDASVRHRTMPLLHLCLGGACAGIVPRSTLDTLSYLYHENAARNRRLTAELLRLLHLLDSQGIPAIPFKGPALALELYGDLGARQCDDLDLIVPGNRVLEVERLLLRRGYVPELDLGAEERERCLRIHDAYSYRSEDAGITVDVHWRILPKAYSVPFETSTLFEPAHGRNAPSSVAAQPETLLLLMLCLHGYMHGWQRLCWIADVSALVRRQPALRWESALRHAARLRCRRILLLGLHLAQAVCATPLPREVVFEIRKDRVIPRLGRNIAAGLFHPDCGRSLLSLVRFHLRARERTADRVRYCWRSAMSTTALDYLNTRVPRGAAWLYPLLRPFRLARKYAFGGGR